MLCGQNSNRNPNLILPIIRSNRSAKPQSAFYWRLLDLQLEITGPIPATALSSVLYKLIICLCRETVQIGTSSISWGINRHTTQCNALAPSLWSCSSGWGPINWRSAPRMGQVAQEGLGFYLQEGRTPRMQVWRTSSTGGGYDRAGDLAPSCRARLQNIHTDKNTLRQPLHNRLVLVRTFSWRQHDTVSWVDRTGCGS